MVWSTSSRRQRLPANWPALRLARLVLDEYRCQYRHSTGRLCRAEANQVDHIIPMADLNGIDDLQSLCGFHHRMKSSKEGGEASGVARAQIKKSFRRVEQHPGLNV